MNKYTKEYVLYGEVHVVIYTEKYEEILYDEVHVVIYTEKYEKILYGEVRVVIYTEKYEEVLYGEVHVVVQQILRAGVVGKQWNFAGLKDLICRFYFFTLDFFLFSFLHYIFQYDVFIVFLHRSNCLGPFLGPLSTTYRFLKKEEGC